MHVYEEGAFTKTRQAVRDIFVVPNRTHCRSAVIFLWSCVAQAQSRGEGAPPHATMHCHEYNEDCYFVFTEHTKLILLT